MGTYEQIKADFLEALKPKEGVKAYDTEAEVVRVEGSTAWVHIPGGVDETPVAMTVNAKAGDSVRVRVSGGSAWITGSDSAPPTDDRVANIAHTIATEAQTKAETAETRAVNAEVMATAAKQIAGDTAQHFWFTSTGGDTGAHITEVTQDVFEADPANGGPNLLARSNGIAVRYGTAELATFGASGATIGLSNESHLKMDYHSMKMIDSNTKEYFKVEDLRDQNGKATITERYLGNGTTTTFYLGFQATNSTYTVTVSDSSGGAVSKGVNSFSFSSAPTDGATITAVYETTSEYAKAFTFGSRGAGTKVGGLSFAAGFANDASGTYSFATGSASTAWALCSFAEGESCLAMARAAHAEGAETQANARNSHAQNENTRAASRAQTALGKYNIADAADTYAVLVGNGTADNARSNALTLEWDGETELALDTTAASGTDHDLYAAISTLGWDSDVIV